MLTKLEDELWKKKRATKVRCTTCVSQYTDNSVLPLTQPWYSQSLCLAYRHIPFSGSRNYYATFVKQKGFANLRSTSSLWAYRFFPQHVNGSSCCVLARSNSGTTVPSRTKFGQPVGRSFPDLGSHTHYQDSFHTHFRLLASLIPSFAVVARLEKRAQREFFSQTCLYRWISLICRVIDWPVEVMYLTKSSRSWRSWTQKLR